MILKNFIALLPVAVSAALLKTVKLRTNEPVANYIEENGLYHFTPNMKIAELIKESGKIKQSSKFISYGNNVSFFFAGIPDIETHMKNLSSGASNNLLLHPENVLYAVKLNINKEQLSNYKLRIQDGAIVHEGDCILRDDQVEIKQLVIDLIEDKNGQKKLGLRERREREISEDDDIVYMNGEPIRIPNIINRNKPSEECLKAIEEEKRRLGYIMGGKLLGNTSTVVHVLDIEGRKTFESTKSVLGKLKEFTEKLIKPKVKAIDENPNKKIKRVLDKYTNKCIIDINHK